MGRILCAWSPSWAIANWRRRNPCIEPQPEPPPPFALLETVRAVRQLFGVSAEAARLGLYVGQKATDALALVPELVTAEAEPDADVSLVFENTYESPPASFAADLAELRRLSGSLEQDARGEDISF